MSIDHPTNRKFVVCLLLVSCATPPAPHPCAEDLTNLTGPDKTAYHVSVACEYFEEQTDSPADLSGTSITVEQGRSYALLKSEPEIFVNYWSGQWERELYHEVFHVLLWRTNPTIDPRYHHSAMLQRRLCVPIGLCGYGRIELNP